MGPDRNQILAFHLLVSIGERSLDSLQATEVVLLTENDPLYRRLGGYLAERFPPVVYTVLVALFFGSALLFSRALDPAGQVAAKAGLGAVVVWLAFLHLRLMDEHKDFEQDSAAYPDRLLSRGVVTLSLLGRLLVLVVSAELVIAWTLGPRALWCWLAMFLFTVAMRYEFGVGRWLSGHIFVYALTHNPVVALLVVFVHASTGLAWDDRYLFYVGMVSVGSLAFEIGRKIREPDEEIPGVESYSTAFGRVGSAWLLRGVLLLSVVLGLLTVWSISPEILGGVATAILVVGLIVAVVGVRPGHRSSRVELVSSVFLLLSFVAVGVGAW